MKEALVYCDDSGNTGENYLDPQQPFFALAGWWVSTDREPDAIAVVRDHLKNHSKEIKGATLLKSGKGQRSILSLIRQLGQASCVPIFVLAEKKYCVAGKIVETFLDPVYNHQVSQAFWNDVDSKQRVADIIYELPEPVLAEFAIAYRALDLNGLEESVKALSLALATANPDLAVAISASLGGLSEVIQGELESEKVIPGRGSRTLNMPAFYAFICTIEQVARIASVTEVSLIHDHIPEFQETLSWVFSLQKNATKADMFLSNGTLIPIGFEFLKNLRFADSRYMPMIQASDILASSLFSVASALIPEEPLKPNLVAIGQSLLPATLAQPQFGGLIASKKVISRMAERIMFVGNPLAKPQKESPLT